MKEEKEGYWGVAFTALQTSNEDVVEIYKKAQAKFTIELETNNIKVYDVMQVGKPTGGCGTPGHPCLK